METEKRYLQHLSEKTTSNVKQYFHAEVLRMQILFEKQQHSMETEASVKEVVQRSVTFQRVAEQYKNATTREEKDRYLSILKPGLTRLEICELLEENITWYRYRVVSHHCDVWGPGGQKMELPYKGLNYSDADIDVVLSFILSPECIQKLAYGEKRVLQTDGTECFLPNFQRVYDVERMWKIFCKFKTNVEMSRSTFTSIVKLVTGSQQSKMAALDMITVRYGFENFIEIRELVNLICIKFPSLNKTLLEVLDYICLFARI